MAKTPAIINDMSTNVNVGMDEVVSVFVAKYENDLFQKKEDLSAQIKKVKASQADLVKELEGTIDRSKYDATVPALNLVTRVSEVSVLFEGTYHVKKPIITVDVGIFDEGSDKKYAVHTKQLHFDIPKESVELNKSLKLELETLNADLLDVINNIKSVGRKERQIRGKISEMKLEQSGHADLLANPEIMQLVQLK